MSGARSPFKAQQNDITGFKSIESLRFVVRVVHKLAVETPILIASALDDLALQVDRVGGVRPGNPEVYPQLVLTFPNNHVECRVELTRKHIGVQVDGLLVSRVPIPEVPLEESKIRRGESLERELLYHCACRRVSIIVVARAFASRGGTALPICRKAGFIVPQNLKPSGKDCSRAASRTEIVRACALS